MIHHYDCPVCKEKSIHPCLKAKDHTVSGEQYEIWECDSCSLRFTQDIPSPDEVGKYYKSEKYISHSDTKEGLINTLYHQVRNITLKSKRNLVLRTSGVSKGSILDIGCGTGAFLHTMKKSGWDVTGIEPDVDARRVAKERYGIVALSSDLFFELPVSRYQIITMWHVLEHVHQLHDYVQHINSMLINGGHLLVAVPNYTSYDAGHYNTAWAAYDVPRHLYHFSPESMSVLMKVHGLEVKNVLPMWFDSFYVSMLSEKYRDGKGSLAKAVYHGLLSNVKALFSKRRCSSLIYVIRKS
jgi:SAM-dependent methyltransferase